MSQISSPKHAMPATKYIVSILPEVRTAVCHRSSLHSQLSHLLHPRTSLSFEQAGKSSCASRKHEDAARDPLALLPGHSQSRTSDPRGRTFMTKPILQSCFHMGTHRPFPTKHATLVTAARRSINRDHLRGIGACRRPLSPVLRQDSRCSER